MSALDASLADDLAAIASANRYRRRRIVEPVDPARPVLVRADGRECVCFCSNDYLGLSTHAEVVAALVAAARRYGVGSGASHLVSGHGPEHHALEEELAELTGRPRALLFSTGYMANLAIASALAGRGDRICEDRLNHASLIDAALTSGARFARYRHADPQSLAQLLGRNVAGRKLVLTDGVFSMDGDLAPLAALAKLSQQHGAVLVVDDAHGLGVLGREGRGSLEQAGLGVEEVPVLMATLGKAMGVFGAFVAGSETLIETLIQRARTYIYTTAMPPAVAAASRAALRVARQESWRRHRLAAHVERFRQRCVGLDLELLPSTTPIQPILFGNEASAIAASEQLFEQGLLVTAIRPPTVPSGSARLRVTLSAAHSEEDVDRLLAALALIARRDDRL